MKRNILRRFGHTQGEHEVIANHKKNEFHIGFFLFQRQPDNSIVAKEYFMEEQGEKKVPMILERRMPRELVDLEYSKDRISFVGTEFRVSTPESVYAKKRHTMKQNTANSKKDLVDVRALEGKVDMRKVEEAEKYKSSTCVVSVDTKEVYR